MVTFLNTEDQKSVDKIRDVYLDCYFEGIDIPKEEWSDIFRNGTDFNIIWSYGVIEALRQAYKINKNTLRKTLIALIERSNKNCEQKISFYPSLKDDYQKRIDSNKRLIKQLMNLW